MRLQMASSILILVLPTTLDQRLDLALVLSMPGGILTRPH